MTRKPVTILVGGAPFDQQDLDYICRQMRPGVDRLIAVDGGVNALPPDLVPDAIAGDLDSLQDVENWRSRTRIIELADQNHTDLEKAVRFADTQSIIGIGFIGGRFDQSLTVLHAVRANPDVSFLFYGEQDLILSLPTGLSTWVSMPDMRVSLYPLSTCRFADSNGLAYPLQGLVMEQGKVIGTSNRAPGTRFSVNMTSGSCLLIVDKNTDSLILEAFVNP